MEVVEVLHLQNRQDDRIVSVQVSREQELQLLTFAINDLMMRGVLSLKPPKEDESERPDLSTIVFEGKPN